MERVHENDNHKMEDSRVDRFLLKLSSWISPRHKILLIMCLTYVYFPVRRNLISFCYSRDFQKSPTTNHRKNIDDLIPKVNLIGLSYYIVSTSVHVGSFLGGLVLIYAEHSDDQRVQTIACYLPRLQLHELFGHSFLVYTAFQFSVCALAWRYLMLIYNSKMKLHTFVYLLIDEHHLSQVSDPSKSYHHSPLRRLVQDLLFYRNGYKINMVTKYHLRPNRLSRVRQRLFRTLEIYFSGSLIIYVIYSMIFSILSSRTSLFHLDAMYPGCDVTVFNWSYLFRFMTSGLLTSVFLLDTLVGCVGPTLVGTLLIDDLLYYWQYIERELRKLRQLIEYPGTLRHNGRPSPTRKYTNETRRGPTSVMDKLFRPDRRSYDLQVMIKDFFDQLQDADCYVSCVIVFALYLWVGLNAVLTFTGNQKAGRDKALVAVLVRGIQLSAICVIIVFSRVLLVLKHSTERGYKSICSIMARDRSLKKTRWLGVLEYYIGRPRYAFTFQQSELFTMATLIRFLSYTFTFIFLIQSLRPHVR